MKKHRYLRKDKHPELTLRSLSDRRKRRRKMERITVGANPLTRRQVRRLPNAETAHAKRKASRLLRRYAKAGYEA